jgi:outer membrane protein assembly factor BamC
MRKLVLAGAAAVLCGCQSVSDYLDRKTDYRSAGPARTLPPLEVPPDLTSPERDGRYAIPEQQTAKSTATFSDYQAGRGRERAQPAGTPGVLPAFDSMKVERAGTQRWLVVQATPERLWPVLKEFWKEQGFELDVEKPELGVMETQWGENRASIPQDPIRRLIGRVADGLYSSGERDKFRTRLERAPEGGTEVYISHRGVEEVQQTGNLGVAPGTGAAPTTWQPRPIDPGLEAEFLQRLMIKLGAQEERAKALAESGQPEYRAEIRKGVDGGELLQVYEPFDRAWRRVGLALDRVGFTVEDRDRQKGLYFVRYADPAKAKDERGFFARMFSLGSGANLKAEQYRVQVSQAGTASQVSVLNKDGAAEASQTASRILALLHEQLK